MIDLNELRTMLRAANEEAAKHGLSKVLQERFLNAIPATYVLEEKREKRS